MPVDQLWYTTLFSDLFFNAKRFRSLNFLDLPAVSGWVFSRRVSRFGKESEPCRANSYEEDFVCATPESWDWRRSTASSRFMIFLGFQNRRSGRSFWRLGLVVVEKEKLKKTVGNQNKKQLENHPNIYSDHFVDVFPVERVGFPCCYFAGWWMVVSLKLTHEKSRLAKYNVLHPEKRTSLLSSCLLSVWNL